MKWHHFPNLIVKHHLLGPTIITERFFSKEFTHNNNNEMNGGFLRKYD